MGKSECVFSDDVIKRKHYFTLRHGSQITSSSFGPIIISSDAECNCLKPVHSVIIESRLIR